MRRLIAAAGLSALLGTSALAQGDEEGRRKDRENGARAPRPQEPRPPADRDSKLVDAPPAVVPPDLLPTMPPDGRIAARGEGFIAVAGDRFVSYDREGRNETELADAGGKVDRWWLSADGKRLAWTSGGKLNVAEIGGAKSTVDAAPATAPAFSPDGARLAYVADGKLVIATADGKERRALSPADSLLLAGPAVFSGDGRRLFCLVASSNAAEPDGVGTADLAGDAPLVTRLYQATNAKLSHLSLAPNGRWLLLIQTPKTDPAQDALRLLSPDGSEFRTLARAAKIADPVFSAEGSKVFFSGVGANRQWGVWEAGLEPDVRSGEIPTRRVAEMDGKQFLRPSPAADGIVLWLIGQNADGSAGQVGRVKLK
ncbi:MAG: PD40 domain-containing protein [Planctomycetes bacterium]|nr:PD40 domain-containing protein [Planctomycetota bacterium]